jgi:uncharacterized protein (TIGR00730 family)
VSPTPEGPLASERRRSICVFLGSHGAPRYEEAAARLGATIAARGHTLVYGGASVGLMGVLADAALAAGGEVVGVLPAGLFDVEVAHRGLTALHETATMHERKALMYDLSDAFVAFPGGFGTLDETFEAITWSALGIHAKPVGFLEVDGFWSPLLTFLHRAVDVGVISERRRDLLVVEDDAAALLDRLAERTPGGDGVITDAER